VKRVLDASFRYRPSFDTDIRRTFAAVRRRERETTPAGAKTGGSVTRLPVARVRADAKQ
jgi:UDP-N-acetylenolpyruvoylglucosamine reductase